MACCQQYTTTADIESHLGALFIRISSNWWWASLVHNENALCGSSCRSQTLLHAASERSR